MTKEKQPVEVRYKNSEGEIIHRETRWYVINKCRKGEYVHSHRARHLILYDGVRFIVKDSRPNGYRVIVPPNTIKEPEVIQLPLTINQAAEAIAEITVSPL